MELLLWFALAIDAAILLAAMVKWQKIAAARHWQATVGRIVSSQAEARLVRKSPIGENMVENSEIRNFAAVTYAFNVGRAKFHGNRLSFGTDTGNAGVTEALKRYPEGMEVTVYYDPSDPENCVLDRDPPSAGFFRTMFGGGLAAGAVIVVLLLGLNGRLNLGSIIRPDLQWTPSLAAAVALAVGALAMASAAVKLQSIHRHWQTTSGTIVSSDAVKLAAQAKLLSPSKYFQSRTVYDYVVDGVRYQSNRISFGDLAFSNSRHFAEEQADRFAPGNRVDVHYDPAAPSSAALQIGDPRLVWWWSAAALALLLLALALTGVLA